MKLRSDSMDEKLSAPRRASRVVSRQNAIIVGLCFVAAIPLALLWSFRSSGFVADDVFFAGHFGFRSWSELLFGAWPHGFHSSKAWRPIVLLTYAAQQRVAQGDPSEYHLFNYFVHGTNAALVAILVRQISGQWRTGLIAAVLFAVHPISQENVLWISGRTYPIAASFLLALCIWTVNAPARRAVYHHAVGVSLMTLALATYEFSIIAPVLVAAVMWVAWKPADRTFNRTAAHLLPYVVVLFAYLLFRWVWLSDFNADVVMVARSSRVIAGVGPIAYRVPHNAIVFLGRLLDWPIASGLSNIALGLGGAWTTAMVCSAAVIIWRCDGLRRQGLFWLVVSVVSFLPIAAYASFSDRFGYLSAAGLAGFIATAMTQVLKSKRSHLRLAACAAIAILALLWARDLRRHAQEWKEAGELAQRIVEQTVKLLGTPTAVTDVHVIDVPLSHGSALVFITYYPLAVHSRYPYEQAKLLQFHLQAPPAEALMSTLGPIAEHDERILVWDSRAETMTLRFSRSAGANEWTCGKPCSPHKAGERLSP